jgi:hypothetical protein
MSEELTAGEFRDDGGAVENHEITQEITEWLADCLTSTIFFVDDN